MSEHLIIYLDESGDLGFDFKNNKTSRFLVIALLVYENDNGTNHIRRCVQKTLRNKAPKNAYELKGSFLTPTVKKYFLNEMKKSENWRLYAGIADKQCWMNHHVMNNSDTAKKKILYEEISKRVLLQLDNLDCVSNLDLVIDRSKNQNEIAAFDAAIVSAIRSRLPRKAKITIRHRSSHEEHGLQAIDVFCSGIGRKYEKNDVVWYNEFSEKIAVEVIYKY